MSVMVNDDSSAGSDNELGSDLQQAELAQGQISESSFHLGMSVNLP